MTRRQFAKRVEKQYKKSGFGYDMLNDLECLCGAMRCYLVNAGRNESPITDEELGVMKVLKLAMEIKRIGCAGDSYAESIHRQSLYERVRGIEL